jgi:uncharacterized membrane protein YagU involved in acid resistance
MLLLLVCLWVGFAAGFVCAAMLGGGRRDLPLRRYPRRDRLAPSGYFTRIATRR